MSALNRLMSFTLIAMLAIVTSSCEFIGDIFEAGVWTGVIVVVGGILLIIFVIAKLFGRKG